MEYLGDVVWPLVVLVLGIYALFLASKFQDDSSYSDEDIAQIKKDVKSLQDKIGVLMLSKSQRSN